VEPIITDKILSLVAQKIQIRNWVSWSSTITVNCHIQVRGVLSYCSRRSMFKMPIRVTRN